MGKFLFLSIFLASAVNAAEKAGMPQLDTKFWFSQFFWLTITFSILFFLLSKFILPKISANLEIRKSQILENISEAEKKREESEIKIKEFEEIVEKSKNESKIFLKQAKEKITKNISIKFLDISNLVFHLSNGGNKRSEMSFEQDQLRKRFVKFK